MQSGGGTVQDRTVKLCDAHLTDLARCLFDSVISTAEHQRANFKDCKFRVIVAKPMVLLCGVSPRAGARGLYKLAEHLGMREALVRTYLSANSDG